MAKLIMTQKEKAVVKPKAGTKTVPDRDIRKDIKAIVEDIDTKWIEFAILAAEVYEGKLWEVWGHNTAEDYARAELGMEYRTFMWRVHTGNVINKLGLSFDQIRRVGASKFKEIAHLLKEDSSPKEVEAYLKKAEKLSFRELAVFVKNERLVSDGNTGVSRRVTLKYRLLNEQADVVAEAIAKAKLFLETDSDDVALEHICMEYLQINVPKSDTDSLHFSDAKAEKVKPKERADKGKKAVKAKAKPKKK